MAGPWDSGADGAKFETMADASFVDIIDKKRARNGGATYFANYDFKDTFNTLSIWNYYATDLYNTFFLQYDYNDKFGTTALNPGIQIINFEQVGRLAQNNLNNYDIHYWLLQAKLDGKFQNHFGFATGIAKYTDGDGQAQTLGAWGGYPYLANGIVFHFFEAGSLRNAYSYKLEGNYHGLKNTIIKMRLTNFALDKKYSFTKTGLAQSYMKMAALQIKYKFLKGGYFTGSYERYTLEHEPTNYALRLIGGYKF